MLPGLGADADVRVHYRGPARSVAIATDGAVPLLGALPRAFGWQNPRALQRLLNVTKGLHDDATIAMLESRSSLASRGEGTERSEKWPAS
jgi:hypothetical protein